MHPETGDIRPVACSSSQELYALSETALITQKAVVRITALSSADMVSQFNMCTLKDDARHFTHEG
jgi:hypothetical protein